MSAPFRFKQFSIQQDRCAMKIGTDGVLLGAWASLKNNPQSILDIGAGTGVIALMLAQRSSAELIDALEIEENAYEQCVENFEASPWSDRLFCYHAGLDEFTDEMTANLDEAETYDLIVSNPPFYNSPLPSTFPPKGENEPSSARKQARFQDALPFDDLLKYSAQLLSTNGVFCLIVPFEHQHEIIELAEKEQLHLQKITKVQGTKEAPIKRSLLQFGFQQEETVRDHLILEEARHQYTPEYTELVKDFYLKL